jgi:thiol-disulfide isomerase/thioredoxin
MMCRATFQLVGIVLLAAGCTGQRRQPTEPLPQLVDSSGLHRAIEQQRGRVVLVDFWATWCGPCLELLPHALDIQRRFAERGLTVITVSLDEPEHRAAVGEFLAGRGANTENLLSSYGVGSAGFAAFGIDDGALPHLRLYDQHGELRRTFGGGGKPLDPEAIERAVEGLLD